MISSGYLSLLYSITEKPLEFWSKRQSQTGRIRKTFDPDLLENVIELQDLERSNNSNTFITCPASTQQLLDVQLPFLVIIVKNLNVQCRFRVQVVDTDDIRHHFHFSNEPFESSLGVRTPVISRVEVKLAPGWNRVELDLGDLTQQAFQSRYKATQRMAISANCRLRRVYFVDRHYQERELAPALLPAFFNYYLIKRGVHMTEKSPPTHKTETQRVSFVQDVQTMSGKLMNDIFTTTNTRLENIFDFKNKMRLMLFSIPIMLRHSDAAPHCMESRACYPCKESESGKVLENWSSAMGLVEGKLEMETSSIVEQSQEASLRLRKTRKQAKLRLRNSEA